jgi:hypothetical protein
MRLTTLALLVLVSAVPAEAVRAGAPLRASLTVTSWKTEGRADPAQRVTLRCNPAGGTHPTPVAACRRLAELGGAAAFAPPPHDRVCTEIYGGPRHALVVGTVSGERIWARLTRRNGCEIGRYDRLAFLLPR